MNRYLGAAVSVLTVIAWAYLALAAPEPQPIIPPIGPADLEQGGANEDEHIEWTDDTSEWVPVPNRTQGSAQWVYNANDVCGVDAPALGQFSLDDTFPFTSATKLCLNDVTANSVDVSALLDDINAGSHTMISRIAGSVLQSASFKIIGIVTDDTTFFTFPVSPETTGGSSFSNNKTYAVSFTQASLAQSISASSGFANELTGGGVDEEILVIKAAGGFHLEAESITRAHLGSGVLTGGVVTINAGDASTFDVTAGTGIVVDWSDTTDPTLTEVSWNAFVGVAVTDIATTTFTGLFMDSTGSILQFGGQLVTPEQHRSLIRIQGLAHSDNTEINAVGIDVTPAYQKVEAALDYIRALGIISTGNTYEADAADLTVKKLAGKSVLPFINQLTDAQNPSTKTDAETSPLLSLTYSFLAGGGSFPQSLETTADPDNYAPAGSLVVVPNNRWTIQRFYYFAQADLTTVEYGQFNYTSLAAAQSAFLTEVHISDPNFSVGTLTTVLFVEEGATDLSDGGTALFVAQ